MVCCDGGGNSLKKGIEAKTIVKRMPDAIVGDLDSLDPEAEQYFRDKGVPIIKIFDQYCTDFEKCLKWLKNRNEGQRMDVIAIGSLGGRVDQGLSQIHHLYKASQNSNLLHGRIYLLSEQSFSFVLDKEWNEIELENGTFTEVCGLIPIGRPAVVTMEGFEWDVMDWATEFGGPQMSTSQHWKKNQLRIKTSERVLFTFELNPKFRG